MPEMSRHHACPLCGGSALEPRWVIDGFDVVRCAGCTLVFVQNVVSGEQLAAHYAGPGDPAYSDENRYCLDHYYLALRKRIEALVPRPGAILDVGCSRGWFLQAMEGWEQHGCEIAAGDAAIARARFGDRIFTGPIEDYPASDGSFDVITMQDVFDHCPDPLAVLAKCQRMLRDGGLLVIKVHNISCLYAKLTGPHFYALIPPSHLFFYDRHTLRLMVGKAGFDLLEVRFIGHLLRVSTIFQRLSRGDRASLAHRISQALEGRALGNFAIRKNLRDIITIFAVKRAGSATIPRP